MIKFILFDWGGTLGDSGTRHTFLFDAVMHNRCATLKRDLIKLLKYLRARNYKLGILSNTKYTAQQMHNALVETGLIKYFDDVFVYSSDPGMCGKPCDKIFKKALLLIAKNNPNIHIDPRTFKTSEVLYVGNNYMKDVGGASKFMKTAFVSNGSLVGDWLGTLFGRHDIMVRELRELAKHL